MHAQRTQESGRIVLHLQPYTFGQGDEWGAEVGIVPWHELLRGLVVEVESATGALRHADGSLNNQSVHGGLLVVAPDGLAQIVQVMKHAPFFGHDRLLLGAERRDGMPLLTCNLCQHHQSR